MTQKTENAYGQPTLTTLKKANHAIESGAEDLNAPAVLPVRNKPMAPSGKLHFSPAKMAVDEEVDLNEFVNPVPMPPPANVELVDQFPGANENSNFPPDMPDDCRSQQHNSRRVPIPMYFVFVQLVMS